MRTVQHRNSDAEIKGELLLAVFINILQRVRACVGAKGGHFENLL